VLVTYVLAMAFTLVYTGEHFVIDEFVGWSYAAIVFVSGSRLLDQWTVTRRHLWLIGPLPDPDTARSQASVTA
jgi:small basic protein